MKKSVRFLLVCCLFVFLAGCEEKDLKGIASLPSGNANVQASSLSEESLSIESSGVPGATDPVITGIKPKKKADDKGNLQKSREDKGGIDVDLSNESATMAYTEMYVMVQSPEEYLGKEIKIKGQYMKLKPDKSGKQLYGIFVYDTACCCQVGIEFCPKDKKSLDGVKTGDTLTVAGTFTTYEEDSETFCTLSDASVGK